MNLIVDNLYLGDHTAAANDIYLKKYGITHVLNITREIACKFPSSFIYKQIKLDDSPDENLMDHFDSTNQFIDDCRVDGGTVLVHCMAGVSRSATVVLAYLVWKQNLTVAQAFKLVRAKRYINPNIGFM